MLALRRAFLKGLAALRRRREECSKRLQARHVMSITPDGWFRRWRKRMALRDQSIGRTGRIQGVKLIIAVHM